jgi:hypothetical protein
VERSLLRGVRFTDEGHRPLAPKPKVFGRRARLMPCQPTQLNHYLAGEEERPFAGQKISRGPLWGLLHGRPHHGLKVRTGRQPSR